MGREREDIGNLFLLLSQPLGIVIEKIPSKPAVRAKLTYESCSDSEQRP